MLRILSIIIIGSLVIACGSNKKVDKTNMEKEAMVIDFSAGPPTYIYKTKGDYNNLVPVILSDDKSTITSYPHPEDLYYKGELAIPVELADGYLLDNRGISENVAFINITYEDYSKLKTTPSADSLITLIIDNNPLVKLYNCGNRHQYKDEIAQLNKIIEEGHLVNCKMVVGEK